jgi:hypothetical protein
MFKHISDFLDVNGAKRFIHNDIQSNLVSNKNFQRILNADEKGSSNIANKIANVINDEAIENSKKRGDQISNILKETGLSSDEVDIFSSELAGKKNIFKEGKDIVNHNKSNVESLSKSLETLEKNDNVLQKTRAITNTPFLKGFYTASDYMGGETLARKKMIAKRAGATVLAANGVADGVQFFSGERGILNEDNERIDIPIMPIF